MPWSCRSFGGLYPFYVDPKGRPFGLCRDACGGNISLARYHGCGHPKVAGLAAVLWLAKWLVGAIQNRKNTPTAVDAPNSTVGMWIFRRFCGILAEKGERVWIK